jgi:hypothetical protein
MYALKREGTLPRRATLKRRAFFVDERSLRRAKRALGLRTDAEVVRAAVDRVAEMEEFWQFMRETRAVLPPGSVETP